MPGGSKTFRIFVSSTFDDLKEERNALQKQVFPSLKRRCLAEGARLQDIDLRWGVSQEASRDQQTMNVCLSEIKRCQEVTPRPNFIVLLGDRYGWCPLPSQIPADEFQKVSNRVPKADQPLLAKWYLRDDNALSPEFVLQPWCEDEYTIEEWGKIEVKLHQILETAATKAGLDEEALFKYRASATHQEIAAGAMSPGAEPEHVFAFLRTIDGLPGNSTAKHFIDLAEDGKPDQKAVDKLSALKSELKEKLPRDNVYGYKAEWKGGRVTTGHLDKLCKDVTESLWNVILSQMGDLEAVDAIEQEEIDQEKFAAERASFFTGRVQILDDIVGYTTYTKGPDDGSLVMFGASGSGKTAVMARAAQMAREKKAGTVVMRFVGTTPESSDGWSLLNSLCRHISRMYGVDESTIPTDYNELVTEFPERLKLATAEKPLILFIDALDQLRPGDPARSPTWIPVELPQNARLVVSTLPLDILDELKNRLPERNFVELMPMPPDEGQALLSKWLKGASRTLQDHQRKEVIGKFAREGLPLYLKLGFEESRRWKSYTPAEETVLAPGIPGIIRENLFRRLADDANHGQVMVSTSLGYLRSGKNGISEDEMTNLLSTNMDLYAWFLGNAVNIPSDVMPFLKQYIERHDKTELSKSKEDREGIRDSDAEKWFNREIRPDRDKLMAFLTSASEKSCSFSLPIVLWSRLFFDLKPYIAELRADGTSVMSFYHRQLGEAVDVAYLEGGAGVQTHRQLAEYFAGQDLVFETDGRTAPNLRKMSELPYQQTLGQMWDELFATLTDFHFLERKAADAGVVEARDTKGNVSKTYTGALQLVDDFGLALQKIPGGGGGERRVGGNPIIVTPVDFGEGLVIRCPFCNTSFPFQEEWLGQEITCPQEGCGKQLKVNPFVVQPQEWKK